MTAIDAIELRERIRMGHQELYPTGCHDPRCSDCRPACGCHMDPVNDASESCDLCSEATETNNGIGWKIVRCPLHDAAGAMLAALKDALRLADLQGQPRVSVIIQAAVARAEGR